MKRLIIGILGIIISITIILITIFVKSDNVTILYVAIINSAIFGLSGIYLVIIRNKVIKTHPLVFGLSVGGIIGLIFLMYVIMFLPQSVKRMNLNIIIMIMIYISIFVSAYYYYKHRRNS